MPSHRQNYGEHAATGPPSTSLYWDVHKHWQDSRRANCHTRALHYKTDSRPMRGGREGEGREGGKEGKEEGDQEELATGTPVPVWGA